MRRIGIVVVILWMICGSGRAQDTTITYYNVYDKVVKKEKDAYTFSRTYLSDKQLFVKELFTINGDLIRIESFKSPKMKIKEGASKYYFASGKKEFEGSYLNNKKQGLWKAYFENGKLSTVSNYEADKKVGDFCSFYASGDTLKFGTYNQEGRTGDWIIYFVNGNVKELTSYNSNAEEEGVQRKFYENEVLQSEGIFKNGKYDSIWTYYHPNGQPCSIEEYAYGELQKFQFYDAKGNEIESGLAPYVVPEFPGGQMALFKFIGQHIVYPRIAMEQSVEGRVVLKLFFDTDGNINNIEIAKDIGYGCGDASVKMVEMMPQWSGGVNHNLPFDFEYYLPIKFKLH